MQAYSPALPVGAQHYYASSFQALKQIVNEGGLRGLWRGVNSAILRTAMVRASLAFVWQGCADQGAMMTGFVGSNTELQFRKGRAGRDGLEGR